MSTFYFGRVSASFPDNLCLHETYRWKPAPIISSSHFLSPDYKIVGFQVLLGYRDSMLAWKIWFNAAWKYPPPDSENNAVVWALSFKFIPTTIYCTRSLTTSRDSVYHNFSHVPLTSWEIPVSLKNYEAIPCPHLGFLSFPVSSSYERFTSSRYWTVSMTPFKGTCDLFGNQIRLFWFSKTFPGRLETRKPPFKCSTSENHVFSFPEWYLYNSLVCTSF